MKRLSLLLFLLAATAFTAAAQLTITTPSLNNVVVGQSYPVVRLQASGAIGSLSWSVAPSSQPLPTGFVFGLAQTGFPQTGTFCFGTIPAGGGPPNCSTAGVTSTTGFYIITLQVRDLQTQVVAQKTFNLIVAPPVQITTVSLPDAILNQAYGSPQGQLQATGGAAASGVGQYLWGLATGSLPPSFTLNPNTGIISTSSATTAGAFSFNVQVTDTNTGYSAFQFFNLNVTAGPLQISTATLPNAIVGTFYQTTVAPAGGVPPYVWGLGSGTNVQGLTIGQGSGIIAGTPTSAGLFQLQVTLHDSAVPAANVVQNFTFRVLAPLTIPTTSLAPGEVGLVYNQTLTASGGTTPVTWSIINGTLPPGLTLGVFSGVITGSPTASGQFPFTAKVTDAGSQSTTALMSINVVAAPSVTTTSLPSGTVGIAYSQTLTSIGGLAPIGWSLLGGNLPAGITLNPSSGLLSGTPTAAGAPSFTIGATDQFGVTAQKILTLTIIGGGQGPSITGNTSFNGTVTVPFSQQLTATGGTLPLTWTVLSGTPPPGLALTAAGLIQGTPTSTGQFSFNVRVSDSAGLTASTTISINVINVTSVLVITSTSLPDGILGITYSPTTLLSTGGTVPISWSVTTGNLPAGLLLNAATGVVSGVPTALGTQTFTVTATDALRATAQKIFTIAINGALTITSGGSFTGTVGTAFSQTVTATGGALPYTWTVRTGTLPAGLQLNASSGAITGTPTAQGIVNVDLQVADNGGQSAILHATFNISPSPNPVPAIVLSSSTQPAVSVTLANPFAALITGTMTLTFNSSVGGTDDMIRFTNSSRVLPFQITAGSTQATFPNAPNAAVIPGTLAGTITLQVTALDSGGTSLLPAAPLTRTIVTNPAVPVISSVTLAQVTGGINVIVTGYSNTREVSSGLFHFNVSSGNTLSQADITVPLSAAYVTWFSNTLANATGGQFTLTMPFSVTQGTGTAITSARVTLTNTVGSSVPLTSP